MFHKPTRNQHRKDLIENLKNELKSNVTPAQAAKIQSVLDSVVEGKLNVGVSPLDKPSSRRVSSQSPGPVVSVAGGGRSASPRLDAMGENLSQSVVIRNVVVPAERPTVRVNPKHNASSPGIISSEADGWKEEIRTRSPRPANTDHVIFPYPEAAHSFTSSPGMRRTSGSIPKPSTPTKSGGGIYDHITTSAGGLKDTNGLTPAPIYPVNNPFRTLPSSVRNSGYGGGGGGTSPRSSSTSIFQENSVSGRSTSPFGARKHFTENNERSETRPYSSPKPTIRVNGPSALTSSPSSRGVDPILHKHNDAHDLNSCTTESTRGGSLPQRRHLDGPPVFVAQSFGEAHNRVAVGRKPVPV
eukprot:PhF_6_TR9208/c0_g1_i2/m.14449